MSEASSSGLDCTSTCWANAETGTAANSAKAATTDTMERPRGFIKKPLDKKEDDRSTTEEPIHPGAASIEEYTLRRNFSEPTRLFFQNRPHRDRHRDQGAEQQQGRRSGRRARGARVVAILGRAQGRVGRPAGRGWRKRVDLSDVRDQAVVAGGVPASYRKIVCGC